MRELNHSPDCTCGHIDCPAKDFQQPSEDGLKNILYQDGTGKLVNVENGKETVIARITKWKITPSE